MAKPLTFRFLRFDTPWAGYVQILKVFNRVQSGQSRPRFGSPIKPGPDTCLDFPLGEKMSPPSIGPSWGYQH